MGKIQIEFEEMIKTRHFDPDFLEKNAFGYYMTQECASLYDGWREAAHFYKKDISDLYYEAHITIEPLLTDELRTFAQDVVKPFKFKLADLLMIKRDKATEQRSDKDTFMTGHSKSRLDIETRTRDAVVWLQQHGIKVWRYKIEDTLLDSKSEDVFGLLAKEVIDNK